MKQTSHDVAVIGGGLAARRFSLREKRFSVIVLEQLPGG